MNKLIFLDIDGVLNCAMTTQRFSQGMRGIDPELVAELMVILQETDARIVISSSWRHMGLPTIKEIMSDNVGPSVADYVFNRVLGVTPTFRGARVRGREIEAWLTHNKPGIGEEWRFVILDDHDDMEPYKDHLYQTDDASGLTEEIGRKVISYLNSEPTFDVATA